MRSRQHPADDDGGLTRQNEPGEQRCLGEHQGADDDVGDRGSDTEQVVE
jgi:hypothetical protein